MASEQKKRMCIISENVSRKNPFHRSFIQMHDCRITHTHTHVCRMQRITIARKRKDGVGEKKEENTNSQQLKNKNPLRKIKMKTSSFLFINSQIK